VLLARQLVGASARFVTVYWGKEMQDWADGKGQRLANKPRDTHHNHFPLVQEQLLPRADGALAALIDDLHERGLLSDTLVVWMGDFGRTPRIDRKYASRDHWPHANTVLFAGAGTPGGLVYGRTDARAAHVIEDPVSPADLSATIFRALGVDPHSVLPGGEGRPFVLSEGEPIAALLA
jgi:arylsulfatase A-like enzyme